MLAVSSTSIDNLMRKKLIIGSVVAALGVIALMVLGVRQSSARHMTLDGLLLQSAEQISGRRIQLAGCTVVPGTIEWDEYRSTVSDYEISRYLSML